MLEEGRWYACTLDSPTGVIGRFESDVLEDTVVLLEALDASRKVRLGRAKLLREVDPDMDWFKGDGMPGRAGNILPERSTECGFSMLLSSPGGRIVVLRTGRPAFPLSCWEDSAC